MGEEIQGSARDAQREVSRWTKAIPQARDRLQSKWLVMLMVPALALAAVASCVGLVLSERGGLPRFPVLFSVAFAVLVWAMRSATLPAAGVGLLVCLTLSLRGSVGFFPRPALSALIVLFVLTFGATRYGRRRKEARGLAEARSGRRASQVVANLGVAAIFAALGWDGACLAALAEATADTVSSEIGQAIGGATWLITKFRRVPAGTDGGVSVGGTLAGMLGAGLVVIVGSPGLVRWTDGVVVFFCACGGLAFDSVLGATVEKRGWLGNDLVNFCSTAFAAGVAWLWL